jgi:hypothetical protein
MRAFPVYRVCTSSYLSRAKYRQSEEDLSPITLMNILLASVTVSKDWVVIVATMELVACPIEKSPARSASLLGISGCRSPGFRWDISEMSLIDGLEIAKALLLGAITTTAVSGGSYKGGKGKSAYLWHCWNT